MVRVVVIQQVLFVILLCLISSMTYVLRVAVCNWLFEAASDAGKSVTLLGGVMEETQLVLMAGGWSPDSVVLHTCI